MTDIASLIIKVDSTDADNATNDLDQLTKTAGKTEKATDKLGKSTGKSSKAFKIQKGAAQQVGFQLQDFAVQVSGGTNALVAFGQQGSQLAGILGPGGALLGAVIAIGSALGGVLFSSLSSTNEELEEFQARMDAVANSIAKVKIRKLSEDIFKQEQALRDLNKAFNELDFDKLEELTGVEGGFFGASRADIIGAARLAISEGEAVRDKLIKNKEELAQKDVELMGPSRELFDKELQRRFGEEKKRIEEKAKLNERAQLDQERLFQMTIAQLDPAASEFNRYADQLDAIESFNISAGEKERLREEAFSQHGERMAAIAKKTSDLTVMAQDQGLTLLTDSQSAALGAIGQITGNIADIAEKGGKKSFQTYKAFAIASALINSTLAASNALANPALPFPLNVGVAASVGALGAVQVGMISQQEYQGARAMGGQVQPGTNYLVGERGPEILTMGTGGGNITPNHAIGGGESNITIVNKTSGNIGRVTEQRISATERAIIIEEAVSTVNRNIANPNSSTSRSLASNTTARRVR